jgi:putative transposase
MRAELVVEALGKVSFIRKYGCTGTRELADRGSQFTFGAIVKVCNEIGLSLSTRATGPSYDHVSSESFWSIIKHEYYNRLTFAIENERIAGINKIMHRYNKSRRNTKVGQISPINYETALVAVNQAA